METRAHHILIGLFIVFALAAGVGFALWMGQTHRGDSTRHYQVVLRESVRGLSVGSPVEYNGINVGEVASLRLNPEDPGQVLARIRVRGDVWVRQDTAATLAMQGLTGRSIIQLIGGTASSPILRSHHDQDPIIVARPSTVARMLDRSEDAVANLNALILSAQSILTPENLGAVRDTLANLARLSDTLATHGGQMGDVLAAVRTSAQQITHTLQAISAFVQTVHHHVDAHLPSIAGNLDQSVMSLAGILQQTDNLLHENQGALRRGLQGTSAIGSTLQELRATLASLRMTLERLNEDPTGYLLNRSPLQEFAP